MLCFIVSNAFDMTFYQPLDCSPPFQAENSSEMNRGGRNMFMSRGRFNQRVEEDRGLTDNFNDRRQLDRFVFIPQFLIILK